MKENKWQQGNIRHAIIFLFDEYHFYCMIKSIHLLGICQVYLTMHTSAGIFF